MADYSGALKKFRDDGYPKAKGDGSGSSDAPPETAGPEPVRTIKLMDDEVKALSEGGVDPGSEVTCQITGKLEGNTLRVMSVESTGIQGPDMGVNPDEAGLGQPPMMQSQTVPSPS